MKGLVIKSPYIEDILSGIKTWEVRGCSTKNIGKIILLKSGTGLALGTVEIYACQEIDLIEYNNWDYRVLRKKDVVASLPYKRTYKWLLKNPQTFINPIPYKHPCGAVIWVNLPDDFIKNGVEK